jgi:hypothetical protein
MKNNDTKLIEEAYANQVRNNLKLGQDNISLFVKQIGTRGNVFANRSYALYDAEGNKLPGTTPLQDGQIVSREWGEYYQVKSGEGGNFIGVPFTPDRNISDKIVATKDDDFKKGEERMGAHFFPKNTSEDAYEAVPRAGSFSAQKQMPDDIFETYEEVGMSSEMAIDDAIDSISEMIVSEVPEASRVAARIAVKKLWQDKIKNWKSFDKIKSF